MAVGFTFRTRAYQKLKNIMYSRTISLSRCLASCRLGFLFRIIWYCIIACMVAEFLVLNCVFFYAFSVISNEFSQIKSVYKNPSLFEKIQNNDRVRSVLSAGKEGGFVSIIQETLERLYVIHHEGDVQEKTPWADPNGKHLKPISFLGVDVSHSGESSYLYKRIISRKNFPYYFLIVDIGANDGLISSNSFNFIQWGWDAVLVEPQAEHVAMAKRNIARYIDPSITPPQSVSFVQAVIGETDGHVRFVRKPKTYGTESHIYVEGQALGEGDSLVSVPSLTVKSLVDRYSIPKNFGILSIDAEGFGAEILRQWLESDFTPAYIIFEKIHRQEALRVTVDYLNEKKYQFVETRGWNMIFEHHP